MVEANVISYLVVVVLFICVVGMCIWSIRSNYVARQFIKNKKYSQDVGDEIFECFMKNVHTSDCELQPFCNGVTDEEIQRCDSCKAEDKKKVIDYINKHGGLGDCRVPHNDKKKFNKVSNIQFITQYLLPTFGTMLGEGGLCEMDQENGYFKNVLCNLAKKRNLK